MKTMITMRTGASSVLTLGLIAVATFGASVLSPAAARADIVAQARIGNADVRVRLNTPDRVIYHEPAPRVVVRYPAWDEHYTSIRWGALSREDHRVAARLSLLSGIGERRLLAQRSHGWSWDHIAHYYDLHPRVIAQARSHRPLQTVAYFGNACDDDDDRDYRDHRDHRGPKGKGGRGKR